MRLCKTVQNNFFQCRTYSFISTDFLVHATNDVINFSKASVQNAANSTTNAATVAKDTLDGALDNVQDIFISNAVSRAVKCLTEAVDQCANEESLYGTKTDVTVALNAGIISITLTNRMD